MLKITLLLFKEELIRKLIQSNLMSLGKKVLFLLLKFRCLSLRVYV